ncbi:MAG: extracellular solute-binding protein [Candidatus Scatosoma sp.]
MKKFTGVLMSGLIVGLLALGAGGCGKKNAYNGYVDDDGVAHVVFMGRDVETERLNYQRVVDSFNATQKKIKVEMEWFTDGTSYNTMLDGLGKNLPDCLMLSNAMFLRYVSAGKLYDYKSRVTEDDLAELYYNGYSAYCYDPQTHTIGLSESAGLYGLPKDMGPVAMCYNATLLQQKVNAYNSTAAEADKIDVQKITDDKNPMKFSEFIALGKKLVTVMDAGQYVCSGYDLQSAVYSNNANFYTDDTASVSAVATDNFIGAIEFMQDLYKYNIVPEASTVSSGGESLFTGGYSIFYYAGPWKTKDYWTAIGNTFTWDLIPVLCGDAEGAVSTSYVGGMGLCVSANSAVKDYAVEFLKYVALDLDAQRSLYSNGQCIPNLCALAEEYTANSQNLLSRPEPAHRSVWIDCINGSSGTDAVTGRYRAEAYTYNETWYTYLTDFMANGSYGSFWKKNKDGTFTDVRTALTAFDSELQAALTEAREYLS